MARSFAKSIVLFFFVNNCSIIDPTTQLDTHISSKLTETLDTNMEVRLLVLSPREFSTSNCPISEKIMQAVLKQVNENMDEQLLRVHGDYENFKLIDWVNIPEVLAGIEFKNSGITSKQIALIGEATGANYLILNSFSLACSKNGSELIQDGISKLIRVGSKKTDAVDVTKFIFHFEDGEIEYPFIRGFLNGNKVSYQKSNGIYVKADK